MRFSYIHRAGISNFLLYKIKKFEKFKNLSLKYCYSYTDFDGSFLYRILDKRKQQQLGIGIEVLWWMQHFMYKAYHCWYQMEKGKEWALCNYDYNRTTISCKQSIFWFLCWPSSIFFHVFKYKIFILNWIS